MFLFLKSHHFGKCSHLIFLYIIGYNNILWIPHDPHPKIWGSRPPTSKIDAYAFNNKTVLQMAKETNTAHR